jgi:hypothetical protein
MSGLLVLGIVLGMWRQALPKLPQLAGDVEN